MFKWAYSWYLNWTGYMKITLKRVDETDRGVFGQFTVGDFTCVSLENHALFIPVGTYKVTLYNSPDHGFKTVPLLHNVPGRSYIEIHWGNFERDSKGCILVGMKRDGPGIDNSVKAFDEIMKRLNGFEEIEIQII